MAAQQQLPIVFSERLNLSSQDIDASALKFNGLTMESDKYICIREQQNGQNVLVTVDMTAGNSIQRRPIPAQAAIMNPQSKIIALRAGETMQIFNIDTKQKLKSFKLSGGAEVKYWRWVNNSTVGFVTASSVFHWAMDGSGDPKKMFDRHSSFPSSAQVINHQASDDGKWLLITGISKGQGGVVGSSQLYSVEKKVSQPLSSHAGCFSTMTRSDGIARQMFSFIEKKPTGPFKLHVMEVGKEKDAPGGIFKIAPREIAFPPDAQDDFPVSLTCARKYDILFLVTKKGYLYLFDQHTGQMIFCNRITVDTVFVSTPLSDGTGVLGVTAGKGQVLQVAVNPQTLVPFLVSMGTQNQLAMQLAGRLNLPGADQMYGAEFDRLFNTGDYKGAARVAADSGQALRTQQTMNRFLQAPQQQGAPHPVLLYFQTLLEKGSLNSVETLELSRRLLQSGKQQMLETWLKDNKLECSEELGDMVVDTNPKMALSVYLRANVPDKVVQCFVLTGEYQNIVQYSVKVGYQPDYILMLQNLVRQNPKAAEDFAKSLANNQPPLVAPGMVADVFMQLNQIQATTSFLLDALKGNRPDEGPLQTRLLEINLLGGSPQVADAIFESQMFSHYDRAHIAQLCEKSGLYQRALEHYSEIDDIKRVIVHTASISPEFMVDFFGNLSGENCIECLNVLMMHNVKANLQIVVQTATKYAEMLGPAELIKLFESYKSYEGLYYFCGAILNVVPDADVTFKYIEAAAKMGQFDTVVKVCRESENYDAEKLKDFLLMEKLADPRPLIHVCDRFGFIDELTSYLYTNKKLQHIEVYVQKVSPQRTPEVVGKLLDLDCDEEFIKKLLDSVRNMCPVDALVAEVEKRNRLRMLQPFLEQRVAEGNTEAATHNAIGKIYITINREPQSFLQNNQFYDSKVVGKFCEKLDPYLAFLAYKRAWGACDDELIEVTTANELFKDQARYCVERQDASLWERVLSNESPHRRRVIDETVQTALPETHNPDEVLTTVKAFMTAELPHELIELLEKIVLQGDEFNNNKNLQNLLILTAIKSDTSRVMDYVHRLDTFDGPDIAKIACSDSYQLFEEAFEIYKKFQLNVDAVDVLLTHLEDLERAVQFAERCSEADSSKVWSHVAKAQLDRNMVKDAIDSYVKSDDPTEHYKEVIEAAEREDQWDDLVRFLEMARKKVKERSIDTELIFSLAKIKKLAELEEFVASPNVADIQAIGDRCYDQGMFDAAKILYNNISNNAKLASCFVQLDQFREAVEAARKANSIRTWKEVNAACVEKSEFRLAAICGLHIIVSPDHLEDLIEQYENRGYSEELMSLMEQGLGLEGAHAGVFTELGILFSKYRPDALMDHIKIYWSRMNVPKMLRACEKARLWEESCYLMIENEEFDSAVACMIEHPESAWDDARFLECVSKVRNKECYYKAAAFYLDYAPLKLNKLLGVLAKKVDHARLVMQFRKADNLPLIMPYLKSVQSENVAAVNDAYNEVLVEEEDFEGLRESIDEHDAFDQLGLAQKLEKHELLEFRRIAAYLYKKNKKYAESMRISKNDKIYKDAIDTAAESGDAAVAEELIKFFVSVEDKESLCAALYTCFDLIRPDLVLEFMWRNQLVDYGMPFFVQYVSNLHDKIQRLEEITAEKTAEEEETAESGVTNYMANQGTFMLANHAYNQPQMMQQQQQQYMMQQQQMQMNGGMNMQGYQ